MKELNKLSIVITKEDVESAKNNGRPRIFDSVDETTRTFLATLVKKIHDQTLSNDASLIVKVAKAKMKALDVYDQVQNACLKAGYKKVSWLSSSILTTAKRLDIPALYGNSKTIVKIK